ncbi:MAG: hypothetical protein ACLU3I_22735 [Acutalibacteraceae bacterium]
MCANASTCARRPSSNALIFAARSTSQVAGYGHFGRADWICRGRRRIWCRLCLQKRKK